MTNLLRNIGSLCMKKPFEEGNEELEVVCGAFLVLWLAFCVSILAIADCKGW